MRRREPEAGQVAARSAAFNWPLLAAFSQQEARLGVAMRAHGPLGSALYEFLRFGVKQGWACLFGGLLLALILATKLWWPAQATLARYDGLFVAALTI